ncbi:unnamed protein product [Linum tenue]|uniref:Uncharacterized protein n=1 Tax=Linum tenue TaxID=586396 RepID=A0AAV0MEX5_9ROSI|nr:unnamed protein product [Linum tenue]
MAAPEAPLNYVGVARKSAAHETNGTAAGKKERGSGKINRGSRATLESRTSRILLQAVQNTGEATARSREEEDSEGTAVATEVRKTEQSTIPDELDSVEEPTSQIYNPSEAEIEEPPPDGWGYKIGFVSGGLPGARSTKKKPSKKGDAQTHKRELLSMKKIKRISTILSKENSRCPL